MGQLSARISVWIVLAVAVAVGIYIETPAPGAFLRICAMVAVAAVGIGLFERRLWLEQRAKAEAEREALSDAWHSEKERADEFERLLHFAEHVGNSTDLEQLRRAIQDALPPLVSTRDIWLTARVGGWHEVFRDGVTDDSPTARSRRGWETFPLRAGGKAIGVLGMAQGAGPFTPRQRRFTTYAASVIAIALKNVQLFQALKAQSVTDMLTGCATRSHGLELLGRELRRAARSGTTASLLMIDADHFKAVNDRHGHLCGDAALSHIGRVLRGSMRATDLPIRYGGEEFLVLLPETSTAGAAKVAESIRQAIAGDTVACGSSNVSVTVSCGITATLAGELDPLTVIGRADAALYIAKSAGRNRIHVHGEPRQESRPNRVESRWSASERREPTRGDRRQRGWGRRSTDEREIRH